MFERRYEWRPLKGFLSKVFVSEIVRKKMGVNKVANQWFKKTFKISSNITVCRWWNLCAHDNGTKFDAATWVVLVL